MWLGDLTPSTKGGFSFGSAESAAASQFILGRTEEKQDSVTSAAPLAFGKKADAEESKAQPIFSVGKSEHTKEESTAKPIFNFSFVKPSEKEPEQAKPAFSFGVQTSTSDQGAAKPSFSFLSSASSSAAIPTTSANSSSVFGSVTSSSNPAPVPAPFVFGQASNTVSSSTFGNSAESTTSQSFGFSQENKPATTSSSTGVAVAPFVFGSGASSSNANPGFTFGATTTSSSTGTFKKTFFSFLPLDSRPKKNVNAINNGMGIPVCVNCYHLCFSSWKEKQPAIPSYGAVDGVFCCTMAVYITFQLIVLLKMSLFAQQMCCMFRVIVQSRIVVSLFLLALKNRNS
uniref:Uncharacterized protein n=1 Tax=Anas platyrhynchos TaxID=8839 RepID=A0A8B9T6P1_ANAPL